KVSNNSSLATANLPRNSFSYIDAKFIAPWPIKRKWFWLNSVLVFVISYLLKRFDLDGWHYLRQIFLAPGQYVDKHSLSHYLVNGLPMLTLGLLLFFSKFTNRFVAGSSFKNASI
ncbi:MAG: hypothetical protein MUF62_02420, partial [Chitinophagaceae bacterium]|nr:hypothetical protein [Chitinophagaceae bacterium]